MKEQFGYFIVPLIVTLFLCCSYKEDKSIVFIDRVVYCNDSLCSLSRINFSSLNSTGDYLAQDANKTIGLLIDSPASKSEESVFKLNTSRHIVYNVGYSDSSNYKMSFNYPLLKIDKYFSLNELLGENKVDLSSDSTFQAIWWGEENFQSIKWESDE